MRILRKFTRGIINCIRRFSHFLILCYISRQGLRSSIFSKPSEIFGVSNLIGTSLQAAEELFIKVGLKEIVPSELSITIFVAIQVCSSFAPAAILLPRMNLLILCVLVLLNWQTILNWQGLFSDSGESQMVLALVLLVLVWEYTIRKGESQPRIALGVPPIHVYDKRALANFADQLRQQF